MLASYVEETTNNPGTATTINLGGAATGRRDFVSSFGSGALVLYTLDNGSQAEWGVGTVTAGSPNTLARTTVIGNTAGTTARLNFSGTTRVFCTLPAPAALLLNPATRDLMAGTVAIGPLAGLRNLLLNANPIVNQRGYVSGTATAGANQYTLDRWRVVTSGQALSFADSAGVRTLTAPSGGVEQVIEGASILGGVYTLSWTGTATATVNGSAISNGGQVTLTGGANATLRLTGGTASLIQLERGGVATPFEMRPIAAELALCQRYCHVGDAGGPTNNDGLFSSGGLATGPFVAFPATLRATPTMSYRDLAGSASRFSDLAATVHNQIPSGGSPVANPTTWGFLPDFAATASGLNRWRIRYTAEAEL
jgi:hypothetical protein